MTFKELKIKKTAPIKVRFDGRAYKLEVLLDDDEEILKIHSFNSAITIPAGTEEYRLVCSLQFDQLIYSPITLSQSLEVRILIKKLLNFYSR